jgi:hypothetical protein
MRHFYLIIAFCLIIKFDFAQQLEWSTYFGGSGMDYIRDIAYDYNGNIYITGNTASSSSISTNGTSLSGAVDAFVAKFDTAGVLKWATYIGGNGVDYGYGIACNQNGDVYITGHTTSSSGIAGSDAFQIKLNGIYDGFIVCYDSTGNKKWGSYIGGSGSDYAYALCIDDLSNIYISGQTSSSDSIATSGSYQSSYSGMNDGFIIKLDMNGNNVWGTYFGGADADYLKALSWHPNGYICLAGQTSSSSGITYGIGNQSIYSGDQDAFLCVFNLDGIISWSTYYGGYYPESAANICVDNNGVIYISGSTYSSNGISTSNAYQANYTLNGDVFLASFDILGNINWATYFGGNEFETGYSLSVNKAGEIYMTGYTASTTSIATTGSLQETNYGFNDAFISKFETNGNLISATYFGGPDQEYAYSSCIIDDDIYFCGYTTSSSGISTSASHQQNYGGFYDGFLTKLEDLPILTKIEKITLESNLPEIYMNQLNNNIFLNNLTKGSEIYVYSSLGALIAEMNVNENTMQLNLSSYLLGIYFIQIKDRNYSRIFRTIKY